MMIWLAIQMNAQFKGHINELPYVIFICCSCFDACEMLWPDTKNSQL